MGYVEPNGRIEIFKGINLDNRYMHTIYFANETAQNNWFTSKLATNGRYFTRQYYTRQNNGVVRLRVPSDDILDYTYMRFQNKETGTPSSVNDPHSTKWFYAFITSINYVNENMTEITFEIDVMQTWFFQTGHRVEPCLIRRTHVSDDTFGINLEAEPIGSEVYDMDEITCKAMHNDFAKGYHIIVQTTADPTSPPSGFAPKDNYLTAGIFNGLWGFKQIATNDAITAEGGLIDQLYDTLGSWNKNEQKADIVSIIQFPSAFIGENPITHADNHNKRYTIQHPRDLGNYVPQNKKLYGYPFSYLFISNMDGSSANYRWEYFDGDVTQPNSDIEFDLCANETGGGEIILFPTAYNGIENNCDAKIVTDNFPKCPFVFDAYQAWIASGGKTKAEFDNYLAKTRGALAIEQAEVGTIVSTATSMVRGISAGATLGNPVTAVAGVGAGALNAAGSIANGYYSVKQTELNIEEANKKLEFTFRDARYQPNTVVGQQSPNIAVGNGLLEYRFFNTHVRKDELVRLDDFLTVFGYAYNKVDTPRLNVGKYWTFIKTEGCVVSGNMPSTSKEAIERIIDGGIFFWNNGDNVGNFEVEARNQYGALINK